MEKKLLIQDIAEAIATKGGINKKESETFVKALFETIEQGLTEDKFVKIKGLGTFKVIAVGERESVNINTGERFSISGHDKITFTPETSLKDLVNRPFSHFQTVILNEETEIEELESVDALSDEQIQGEGISENQDPNVLGMLSVSPASGNIVETDTEEVPSTNSAEVPIKKLIFPQEENSLKNLTSPAENTQENAISSIAIDFPEGTDAQKASTESGKNAETLASTSELNIREEIADEIIDKNSKGNEDNVPTGDSVNISSVKENENGITDEVTNTNDYLQADIDDESAEGNEAQSDIAVKDDSIAVEENIDFQENDESISSHAQNSSEDCDNSDVESEVADTSEIGEDSAPSMIITNNGEKKKRNFWKTIAFGLLAILILLLTYFAGYFKVFCPCEIWNNTNSTENLPLIPPISPDSVYIEQDSLLTDTTNAINDSISLNKDTLNLLETTVIANGKTQTKTTLESQKTKELQRPQKKEEQPRFKQVEGGKYLIIGTLRTHKIERGETIRTIAQEVYGSKGYATYIITHNELANPNLIDTGTVIKLPKLEKKHL